MPFHNRRPSKNIFPYTPSKFPSLGQYISSLHTLPHAFLNFKQSFKLFIAIIYFHFYDATLFRLHKMHKYCTFTTNVLK